MKKFLTALICAVTVMLSAFGLTACGGDKGEVAVYMPDGATALSMARLMTENKSFEKEVSYHVVDGTVIQTYVTGENPAADICVLPVNLASKLLGDGKTYKMLGTLTHGNLYLLKKSGADITKDNIASLTGKTVGVIQLAQVPGLTFEVILKDAGLQDKVNLKAVTPAEVLPPEADCDYYVVPEPAATTKVNATSGKLSFAGSLQELYGEGHGYPQAVIVAKNSLIEQSPEFIKGFLTAVEDNSEWLLGDGIEAYFNDIVGAINKNMASGSQSTITVAALNKQVITNCAIKFVKSEVCKTEVNSFLEKLIAVNATSASAVSDSFYYNA
ncbi:MAG: ABC transporter substrate-binding protein [Clostridia bacterium]|nr:ABC transporter substrate-binding protein [Clostridia bacterium]